MKKIINSLIVLQLVILLTGCCCPCGKQPSKPETALEEQKQASEAESK